MAGPPEGVAAWPFREECAVLRERLDEELKVAMRARDAVTLSVIRMVKAAVLDQETRAERTTLDDDGIVRVVEKEIKERRAAIEDFERGGRQDLVDKALGEITVLQTFLPAQLSADELAALVKRAVEETGASGPKDMGRVMGWLTPHTRGRAEGRVVSDLVKAHLAP
jgi:hypothetical protein